MHYFDVKHLPFIGLEFCECSGEVMLADETFELRSEGLLFCAEIGPSFGA